jgi:4-amino-4-deoxy-L-arabinose transferase-like glycosyltransferase
MIAAVAAAVRVPVLVRVPMWWDEVWSMWQTRGTLGQTIAITPYDWPPFYYVVLWGWTALVGHGDVSGRVLSLLFALGTVALLYGTGRAIAGEWAGRLVALLFAVLPYPAYVSLEARGYSLLLLLAAALAWVHVEWLRRPSAARSGLLAVVAAACVYTSYTGLLLVALVLAHAALATAWVPAGKRARHLARVAAIGGVVLALLVPIATWLASIARLKWRHIAEGNLRPPGFDDLLPNYARWVAGGQPLLMGVLVTLAVIGLVRWCRARPGSDTTRLVVLLLIWAVGVPVGMHLLRYQMHLVSLRYVVYGVPGLLLVMGVGLSQLPATARWLAVSVLLAYAALPLPFELYRPKYSDEKPPARPSGRWLGPTSRATPSCSIPAASAAAPSNGRTGSPSTIRVASWPASPTSGKPAVVSGTGRTTGRSIGDWRPGSRAGGSARSASANTTCRASSTRPPRTPPVGQ